MTDSEPQHRDELPEDLDVTAYVGPYTFPDIKRRRIPGVIYMMLGGLMFALGATRGDEGVFVNRGFTAVGVALVAIGLYHLRAAWPLLVRETDALVAATREVGFPVGHASAQLAWRGLLSRPTWRILLYSAENPPQKRGLVLVDGVQGDVIDHLVEDNPENPEDWR
jgi:hypothetical protein